ncbi:hypothetical protein ACFQ3L_07605 [Lacticaseibacillus jixianensis]|uniref:LPXTG cell wall anchor domain-containing protein n=1 Tax=Lacticaseibacillus jixianensis TaxID=2486012 RepID=A0ABW4BAS2_9LACO|nr:hypothetical protein [Lacticaseibacillus jixianensis]
MKKWVVILLGLGVMLFCLTERQQAVAADVQVSIASFVLKPSPPSQPTPPAPSEQPPAKPVSERPSQSLPATGSRDERRLTWWGLVLVVVILMQCGRERGRHAI